MHGGPSGKGYSPEQIQEFMTAASRGNWPLRRDVLKVPAQDRYLNVKDIDVPNGAALVMDAVSLAKGKDADSLALQMAGYAKDAPEMFEKGTAGYKDNIDALTLMFSSHAQTILPTLTDRTRTSPPVSAIQAVSNTLRTAQSWRRCSRPLCSIRIPLSATH